MAIPALIVLGLAACERPPDGNVDARRPGSPTAIPPEARQGDTLGGADSFPVQTSRSASDPAIAPSIRGLVATLHGTDDRPAIRGAVHFRRVEGGVAASSALEGLEAGTHSIRLHLYGDCSAPEGESVGPGLDLAALSGPDAPASGKAPPRGEIGLVHTTGGPARAQQILPLDGASLGQLKGRAVVLYGPPDDPDRPDEGRPVACGVIGTTDASANL